MPRKSIQVRERKFPGKRIWGEADKEARVIEIDPRLSEPQRLDTLIHEALHVTLPFLEEEAVDTAATEVANVLWRDGWRRG